MELAERLSRLESLLAAVPALERDLEVINLQLARAEGKLSRGEHDVRSELRIVEQRLERAERRITSRAFRGEIEGARSVRNLGVG